MSGGNAIEVEHLDAGYPGVKVLEDVSFTITVGSAFLVGDVTGDGVVNAAAVTALANYIVGNGTLANEPAAYVNDDDKIDIADVAALIGLIK